ncbi:Neurogenic locus notch -like protein 2, partial [Trichinella pseudospiralis]
LKRGSEFKCATFQCMCVCVKKDSIIIALMLAICYDSVSGEGATELYSCPVDKYKFILKGGKRLPDSCTTFVPSNRLYENPDNLAPNLTPIKSNNNTLLDNMYEYCQLNFKNGVPLSYMDSTAYNYHKNYAYMEGKASVHSAVEVAKTDGPHLQMRLSTSTYVMSEHTCFNNTARYFNLSRGMISTKEMERCYTEDSYLFFMIYRRGSKITPDWWSDYSFEKSNKEVKSSSDANCRCMQLFSNNEIYIFNSDVQRCSIDNCQYFACVSSAYKNCIEERIEQCTFPPNETICREYTYVRRQEADIPYGKECPERDYGEICECPCSDKPWSEWSAKSTTCGPYTRERYKVVREFENVEVDCTKERHKCCFSIEQGLQTNCTDFFINSNKTIMEYNETCNKHGQIIKTEAGYFCECSSNYHGVLCDEEHAFCNENPNICQNNGTCIDVGSSYICHCKPGYRGVNCTIESISCGSGRECLNQGTCTKKNGKHVCMCPPLFTGTLCEYNTGICKKDTCKNGGTCLILESAYFTCRCKEDFKGSFCEKSVSTLEKYFRMLSDSGIDILIIVCIVFLGLFILISTILRHMDVIIKMRRRYQRKRYKTKRYL